MRLTREQIAAIHQAAVETFHGDAQVRLFGSRTNDNARGGDIDLHIQTNAEHADFKHEIDFHRRLENYLGEQRIDIILRDRNAPLSGIDQIALETGILL